MKFINLLKEEIKIFII